MGEILLRITEIAEILLGIGLCYLAFKSIQKAVETKSKGKTFLRGSFSVVAGGLGFENVLDGFIKEGNTMTAVWVDFLCSTIIAIVVWCFVFLVQRSKYS